MNLVLALQGTRNATVKTWFIAVVLKFDGELQSVVELFRPRLHGGGLGLSNTKPLDVTFLLSNKYNIYKKSEEYSTSYSLNCPEIFNVPSSKPKTQTHPSNTQITLKPEPLSSTQIRPFQQTTFYQALRPTKLYKSPPSTHHLRELTPSSMSSESQPISAPRFAAALPALSLESLHAKAAEIRNSIAHLKSSNEQLREYAVQGDKDCYEAMVENEEVIERMEQRVELLKKEVEGRGMKWVEEGEDQANKNGVNGEDAVEDGRMDGVEEHRNGLGGVTAADTEDGTRRAPAVTERLTDEELRRMLAERMAEGDEDGVHL